MHTTFVIGAGASCEFGLPSGETLKNQIASALDLHYLYPGHLESGNQDIADAIMEMATVDQLRDTGPYANAASEIAKTMMLAPSIDNFLNSRRDDRFINAVGKVAITRLILDSERASTLRLTADRYLEFDFSSSQGTWINFLFKLLSTDCTFDEFETRLSTISFIIFNYDRCIEFFIAFAIAKYYNVSFQKAADAARRIKVLHPYGTVGELRYPFDSAGSGTTFGDNPSRQQLVSISKQLRTFSEETESENLAGIRSLVECTSRLVFLGFAFHQINMKLLIGENKLQALEVYASTYKMSNSAIARAKGDLARHVYRGPSFEMAAPSLTCSGFMSDYYTALAF